MINPEARAAIERLRRHEAGEPMLEIYCPRKQGEEWTHMAPTIAYEQLQDDRVIAARELLRIAPLFDRYADETPIDEAWLRSVGFLPDGEDTGEFARKIWSAGETEDYGTDPAMHIVWSTIDDSCWLEAYDRDGKSLAVIELDGIKTRGQLRRLTDALGIELKEEPKP